MKQFAAVSIALLIISAPQAFAYETEKAKSESGTRFLETPSGRRAVSGAAVVDGRMNGTGGEAPVVLAVRSSDKHGVKLAQARVVPALEPASQASESKVVRYTIAGALIGGGLGAIVGSFLLAGTIPGAAVGAKWGAAIFLALGAGIGLLNAP
jgi:hypothetical protein